jgi:hypothetical protein
MNFVKKCRKRSTGFNLWVFDFDFFGVGKAQQFKNTQAEACATKIR